MYRVVAPFANGHLPSTLPPHVRRKSARDLIDHPHVERVTVQPPALRGAARPSAPRQIGPDGVVEK